MAFPSQIIDSDKALSTRELILMAAYEEIHRVGYQAASINNILDDTGVTKGALYHHFPAKIDLGYAVLDEVISGMVNAYWIQPLKTGNPIDIMINLIIQAGDGITQEEIILGCPMNNLAQEMSPIDAGFRQRIDRIYENWRTGLSKALLNGQKEGFVSSEVNPVQMGTMLVATLEGCIGLAKSAQSKDMLMDCGSGLIHILNSLRRESGV